MNMTGVEIAIEMAKDKSITWFERGDHSEIKSWWQIIREGEEVKNDYDRI